MAASRDLSDFELDALKETANIGTGHASMALSSLLGQKVNIDLPKTIVVPVRDAGEYISSAEESIVGIYSRLSKGIEGNILFVIPVSVALKLLATLDKAATDGRAKLSKADLEILKKLGSVICSAYLSGVAQFFEERIEFRAPNVVSAIGRSIADFAMVEIEDDEKVLLISVGFNTEDTEVQGAFTLLFTTTSLSPLLEKLKQKMGMG